MTAAELHAARKRLGFTLEKLAESIPYDMATLWRMEKGKRKVSATVELGVLRLEKKVKP